MGLFDCKSVLNIVLASIVAFYVIRDYTNRKVDIFAIGGSTTINAQTANEKLIQHSKIWKKDTGEIIEVTSGVFVGIGFSLANVIIIETDKSLIIVDTTESISAAIEIRKLFNESTPKSTHSKPISTIIYTHFHPDHTNGGAAFIDDPSNPPNIYAHPYALEQLTRIFSIASSVNNIRSMRQFGLLLHEIDQKNPEKKLFENSGIGPFLKFGDQYEGYITMPNKLLNEDFTSLTIDNIKLDIYFAPGETPDQIFIYLPQKRVLLPADNIYEAFPNIYAIRGSPTRNARKWVHSLDKMRAVKPKPLYLVPCHTRPVYGEKEIADLLRDYRDGISLVHDQTVRFLNKGLYPEQIIPLVHMNMPQRLKQHPYLQEFYGTIDWSVRGIFHSYLGWFSGDAADLYPLSKIQTGQYLIDTLMNGDTHKLLSIATKHIRDHNGQRDSCQWGLNIATNVYYYYRMKQAKHSNKKTSKTDSEIMNKAKYIRMDGLNCMASFMTSANGRNYYLTQAIEEELPSGDMMPSRKKVDWALQRVPVDQIMSMSLVRLKIEEMDDKWKNAKICYDFEEKWYQITLRDGIGEMRRGYSNEWKLRMEKQKEINEIENTIETIMTKYAFIIFNISKEECYESDYVMQCTEQDFIDSISEYRTTSASLYAKGRIKMKRGTVLDMTKWKSLLELQ